MIVPPRTLVLWCRDWPVRTWGVPASRPAAVIEANVVVAATPAARMAGVGEGLRRREAQARCPDLEVLPRDADREARAFEVVVAALEAFAPLVEVTCPGMCAVATRGPSRYFGGDEALAVSVLNAVASALGGEGGNRVGVADGHFAASWAARLAAPGRGEPDSGTAALWREVARGVRIVEVGESARFLAPLPIGRLEDTDLVGVLWQLGLRTLGDFARLPAADVLARFGVEAARLHRLAAGEDGRPLDARRPPPDLAAVLELDPPIEGIDQAAFAAKTLADRLHGLLSERGVACTRVAVEAETDHGETLRRLWRHEGVLSPTAMAERVRWQLEGWLQAPAGVRPTAGLVRLALVPDDLVAARGRQLGFWGGEDQAAERAARAAARVASLIGMDRVTVVERRGGRDPAEQFAAVAVAAVDLVERSPLPPPAAPWPGRLPLSPATLAVEPRPVVVVDAEGREVMVSGRGVVSAAPARVDGMEVTAWAGPWPIEERWWDGERRRRQARFQLVLSDGRALLLVVEAGCWWQVADYD